MQNKNEPNLKELNYQRLKENFRDPLFEGFEEAFRSIAQWLITLNGSGLIASLAFLGTIFSERFSFTFLPFKWSIIFFGSGCLSAFLIIICNFIYFWLRINQYFQKVINTNSQELDKKLSNLVDYKNLLKSLGQDGKQRFCLYITNGCLVLGSICFIAGMGTGFYYLLLLINDF